ncbi:hypothetical protein K488DRAFT_78853 [Vararia minispora EC-137]|uniref:Uncharacterized protein n=1 Tax=Vararia minispora EC-137 TaxID=1314806 RepID=A0ACB8QJR9_9AGAM|nr:hypothetical protein K488DRAFT_78853 [Vararia minispora EC-137]
MSATPAEVVFSVSVNTMNEWARRTGIPLTPSADALNITYARARRWLLQIKADLIAKHHFHEVTPPDSGIMIAIECSSPFRSSGGLSRSPPFGINIPHHASTFFDPKRRVQWEMVFHSAAFAYMRHTCPPVADLLHLLQCIITGLIVLVKEERTPGQPLYRTIRGLPPVEWVAAYRDHLTDVLGDSAYRTLYRAAGDKRTSFMLEVEQ